MRKFLFILFFILSYTNCEAINSEIKDTSKIEKIQIDLKPEIAQQLKLSCLNADFDGLIKFLGSRVDFMLIKQDDIIQDCMTDYGAVENLNNLIKTINYSFFKITSGLNSDSELLFTITLFIKENQNQYEVHISFILDDKSEIETVAIY